MHQLGKWEALYDRHTHWKVWFQSYVPVCFRLTQCMESNSKLLWLLYVTMFIIFVSNVIFKFNIYIWKTNKILWISMYVQCMYCDGECALEIWHNNSQFKSLYIDACSIFIPYTLYDIPHWTINLFHEYLSLEWVSFLTEKPCLLKRIFCYLRVQPVSTRSLWAPRLVVLPNLLPYELCSTRQRTEI